MMREQEINRRAIAEWIEDGRNHPVDGRASRFVVPGRRPICHLPDQQADEMLLSFTPIEKTNNILILYTAELLPTLATRGFANVTITTKDHDPFIAGIVKACNHYFNTNYKYMTIDEIEEKNMKFDVVFANPPYAGSQELHQQFFNKAVEEFVVEGGMVCFIQPATAYINHKPNQKAQNAKMKELVCEHTVDVKLYPKNVFKDVAVNAGVAVTRLIKDYSQSGKIDNLTYKSGDNYKNVDLNYVNKLGIRPDLYAGLKTKILKQASNGNVDDNCVSVHKDSRDGAVGLKLINMNGTDRRDEYNIIPFQPERQIFFDTIKESADHDKTALILKMSPSQKEGAKSYFKTRLARFALTIYKFNGNNHVGEFRSVPLVDFDQEWTDEKLMAEWGITEEEFEEVKKVIIPTYD
jgi:hypothetical protein